MTMLVDAVRQHAEYESDEEVRTAIEGTLAALDRRIAKGEVEDLVESFPQRWEVPDHEGVPEEATPLNQGEFVEYVADRTNVDRERAYDYVESVFGGMADVSPEEFDRAATQFSPDYERLLVDVDIDVSLE